MAINTKKEILSIEIPDLNVSSKQKNARLLRLEGEEGISQLYEFRLHVSHTHKENEFLDLNKLIGKEVHITVNNHETGEPLRHINGFVKRANIGQLKKGHVAHTQSDYHLEVVPKLWFLTQTKDCKIFQDKTIEDIIKEILKEFSIEYEKIDLRDSPYSKYEYCVQYQESPYNFLQRLMEKEGLYYFFKHEEKETKLIIADHDDYKPIDSDTVEWGEYVAVTQGQQVESYKPIINEWGYYENFFIPKVSKADFDYLRPPTPSAAGDLSYAQTERKADDIFDYPAKFEKESQPTERDKFKKVHEEQLQTYKNVYRGVSNCIELVPGHSFKLTKFPDKKHNQEYLVTKLHTVIVPQDLGSTREGIQFTILSIPANKSGGEKRQFRPQATTPKPTIDGIQTAIVVGPQSEEIHTGIHTDEYGRVKVVFPWDREFYKDNPKKPPTSSGSEKRTCWIRVAQLLAGPGWGGQFIPRIGQEVIVTFENGDPDRPLITGAVYNKGTGLPFSLPKEKFKMGLRSRSEKGQQTDCNEIFFDDSQGKELFSIQAQKDFKAKIKNNADIEIKGDKKETIEKTLTVEVKEKITLKVGGSTVEITPDSVTVKSGKINLN